MTFEDIRVKANDQHPKTLINNSELRNIMEAASALTRFGDEESDIAAPVSPKEEEKAEQPEQETADEPENPAKPAKRFIPEYKKPNAALTFPEKVSRGW